MASFITNDGVNASVTSYASAAFGAGSQVARALQGKTKTVSFVRGGTTLVTFDAVVQENHGLDAQPTVYPVEDGSTISDHVIRVPQELNLQGIVTDTPLNNAALLVDEVVSSAIGIGAGPIGSFAVRAATTAPQRFASARSVAQSESPSIAAFQQILSLAQGTPTQPPLPFTVRTAICDYPNMIIRQVQVPRDVTTGDALVFGITLTTMNIVASATFAAAVSASAGRQNLERKKEGERSVNQSALTYKEGANSVDVSNGAELRYKDAPAVYTGR